MGDTSTIPLDTENGMEVDGETGIHDYTNEDKQGGRISSIAGCPVSSGGQYNFKNTNLTFYVEPNPDAEQRAYLDPQVI